MLQDIIEVVGPFLLKALTVAASLVVFAPLVAGLLAPIFG
jgi:hypothetical protein